MFEGFGIPVGLLSALCFVESSHRSIDVLDTNGRVSHGICQVQEGAARQVGIKETSLIRTKKGNIRAAALYLSYGRERCGTWIGALHQYNTGKCGKTIGPYVRKVLERWSQQ